MRVSIGVALTRFRAILGGGSGQPVPAVGAFSAAFSSAYDVLR